MTTMRRAFTMRLGVTLVEQHGYDVDDAPDHRLVLSRLRVDRLDVVRGDMPGAFVEGTTVAIGDRVGGAGLTIAYPTYTFADGKIFGKQTVQFTVHQRAGKPEQEATGEWEWTGGTGRLRAVRGRGRLRRRSLRGRAASRSARSNTTASTGSSRTPAEHARASCPPC